MDWSRYPLEKLFSFVAAIIPGAVALLMSPPALGWLLALGSFGYRTRIAILLITAFLIGFTLTTFLEALLGAIGGALGAASYKPPHSYSVAPWRDPSWRALVKQKLGSNSPNDTRPISPVIFDLRSKLISNLPPEQQPPERFKLESERLSAEADDLAWSTWYDHYHRLLVQPDERDVYLQVHTGLRFSIETAAVYVLLSSMLVPMARHWWCIIPASIWTLLLIVECMQSAKKALDKWSTLSGQMKYLSGIGIGHAVGKV